MALPGIGRHLGPQQAIVLLCLLALAALCWRFIVDMSWMAAFPMAGGPFAAGPLLANATMWIVMMAGMMLPGALPVILLVQRVSRARSATPGLAVALFVAGYLLVWSAFAVVATLLQAALLAAGAIDGTLTAISGRLSGALFVAAGLYQATPLKAACLAKCQSPLAFVLWHWRKGRLGTLRMGLEHGLFCTGCCWVLMLLLFATGVMNVTAVALLAAFVLVEKLAPWSRALRMTTSGALVLIGVCFLVVA